MAPDIFHYQKFDIRQSHAAMKVGTDSDLLGTLCAGGNQILDIGTGTGIISLMLAQRYPQSQIIAIEMDENAVIDAQYNFEQSPWIDRLSLQHITFQEYLNASPLPRFDAVVCNPPYFNRSLECPNQGRTRARHTSSLPFSVLTQGASDLLSEDGRFSVCIPPEVLDDFLAHCQKAGLSLEYCYQIKMVPEKPEKRFVLVCRKGTIVQPQFFKFCMRNSDRMRSPWYRAQMQDFLICGDK